MTEEEELNAGVARYQSEFNELYDIGREGAFEFLRAEVERVSRFSKHHSTRCLATEWFERRRVADLEFERSKTSGGQVCGSNDLDRNLIRFAARMLASDDQENKRCLK